MKKVIIALVTFVSAYVFIFRKISLEDIQLALDNASWGYMFMGALCMILFVLCEAKNLKTGLGLRKKHIDDSKYIKYAATGFFYSAVTPSATGGQPMQLLSMKKDGHDVSDSVMALLLHSSGQQLVSIFYGIIGYAYINYGNYDLPKAFNVLFITGLLINIGVLLFYLIGVFASNKAKGIVSYLAEKIRYIKERENRIKKKIAEYSATALFLKKNKKYMVKVLLTNLVQFAAYNMVPCFVCLALGLDDILITVLFMQAMLNISVSMIPVPGTIGANEGVFTLIYAGLLGATSVGPIMVLVRLINYYIPVLFTGAITLLNMKEIKAQ